MRKKTPKRTPHENALLDLLATQIRRKRAVRELTNEVLSGKSGISPRNLQKLQKGDVNIRFTTLARLKKALKCKSWDELLPDWDDAEASPKRKGTKSKDD
ncbi:MAG: helix-turn-helix domain-containing protein [Verrucomicrobiota bacterium JB024]|nr:helix-turn-helix domain-containing protein [Verrucomicrobiota bacterium JB024]